MTTNLTQPGVERPATRTNLTHQFLGRVERLFALLGTIPLATEVQLLKRDLAQGGETSFLSVVTLVESALACLTWKQFTSEVVAALRDAFSAGTCAASFTFPDYEAVRRLFAERGIPSINLDSLEPEDLEDVQEG